MRWAWAPDIVVTDRPSSSNVFSALCAMLACLFQICLCFFESAALRSKPFHAKLVSCLRLCWLKSLACVEQVHEGELDRANQEPFTSLCEAHQSNQLWRLLLLPDVGTQGLGYARYTCCMPALQQVLQKPRRIHCLPDRPNRGKLFSHFSLPFCLPLSISPFQVP